MSISQRTTKLILATCLACLLAYFLNLSSAVSAGIIALLSLSDTRRSTLKLARNRLFSMLLALTIGVLAFNLSGFHIWSLGLYLALYVPLAYKMGWEIGITPSTVLVSHLLIQESTSPYPVSYTHLDVYKRQVCAWLLRKARCFDVNDIIFFLVF